MQAAGITSLLFCVIWMFLLFVNHLLGAQLCFGVALFFMIGSLVLSLWEIWISVEAVNLHVKGIKEVKGP
jgi:hypothetical protein